MWAAPCPMFQSCRFVCSLGSYGPAHSCLTLLVRVVSPFLGGRPRVSNPRFAATSLDFPGRTECVWGVIAWINIQIRVLAKLDGAETAMWVSAK